MTWVNVMDGGKLLFRYETDARLVEIKTGPVLRYVDLKRYEREDVCALTDPVDKGGKRGYTVKAT